MTYWKKTQNTYFCNGEKSLQELKDSICYTILRIRKYKEVLFIEAYRTMIGTKIRHFIIIFKDRTINKISNSEKVPKTTFKKDWYDESEDACFFNVAIVK